MSAEIAFRHTDRRWRGLVLPILLLGCWTGASVLGLGNPHILVSPRAVLLGIHDALGDGGLIQSIGTSLFHMLAGWIVGASLGIVCGLGLGLSRLARRVVAPSIDGLRQIALFAWIPLLTAWLGDGDGAKIALVALAAFFPTALNTVRACQAVPTTYREVGLALEFSATMTITRIIVPAATPAIVSGLQIALAAAWIGTVGAEYLIQTGNGIGTFLAAAREANRMDQVVIGIVVLALLGLGMTRGLERLTRSWSLVP